MDTFHCVCIVFKIYFGARGYCKYFPLFITIITQTFWLSAFFSNPACQWLFTHCLTRQTLFYQRCRIPCDPSEPPGPAKTRLDFLTNPSLDISRGCPSLTAQFQGHSVLRALRRCCHIRHVEMSTPF